MVGIGVAVDVNPDRVATGRPSHHEGSGPPTRVVAGESWCSFEEPESFRAGRWRTHDELSVRSDWRRRARSAVIAVSGAGEHGGDGVLDDLQMLGHRACRGVVRPPGDRLDNHVVFDVGSMLTRGEEVDRS